MNNLMNNIQYLALRNKYENYIEQIVDFYKPKYQKIFNKDTVRNSTIICLAFSDHKIVGAVRALSDLSRHAIIVDLMVDEKYRNQNIGSKLLGNIVLELQKSKVANISLTTEPNREKLVNYYIKNGFTPLSGSIHMIFSSIDKR